jgi:site-specific DNA-methyltransferase (adenine-specific)
VDQENQIIAGERRSRAYRLLATWSICAECFYAQEMPFALCPECSSSESVDQEPWMQIPVKVIEVEDEYHRELLELEENINREDLTPAERGAATADLHDLLVKRGGKRIGGSRGGWSAADTANRLGISAARVSQHRRTQRFVASDPSLAAETTESAIWTKFRSSRLTAIRAEIARRHRIRGDGPSVMLKCGDAPTLMGDLDAESIDLVIADVPFGIEVFSSLAMKDSRHDPQWIDTKKVTDGFLTKLMPEISRVLRKDTHCYIFCAWHQTFLIERLAEIVDLDMELPPLVWDRLEATPNRQETMGHDLQHEYIVHLRKGHPGGDVRLGSNVKSFRRLTGTKYPNEKPLELVRDLIRRSSFIKQNVLDPCCGSGSVVIAALQEGREPIGFDINQSAIDVTESRIAIEITGAEERGAEESDREGSPQPIEGFKAGTDQTLDIDDIG